MGTQKDPAMMPCNSRGVLAANMEPRRLLHAGHRLTRLAPIGRQRLAVCAAKGAKGSKGVQISLSADGGGYGMRGELAQLFQQALDAAYPEAGEKAIVEQCGNPQFGDYQCNNAMAMFGKMKGKEGAPKAPRDLASSVLAALPANSIVSETSLAGPGFINIKLHRSHLSERINTMLAEGIGSWAPRLSNARRVVVDFSSPNVAKEMHVGHLRSTVIGDTLCRCLEFCGVETLRLNHVGDWGTQFGMLIQHMAEAQPGGLAAPVQGASELMALYREAKRRFDEDEAFKGRAREAVTLLQSGDEASLAAWRAICGASRQEFQGCTTAWAWRPQSAARASTTRCLSRWWRSWGHWGSPRSAREPPACSWRGPRCRSL